MDARGLVKHLEGGALLPFYLVYGEEHYAAERMAERIVAAAQPDGDGGMDRETLPSDTTPDQIVACARTLAWIAPKRVVIVKDYAPLMSTKAKAADQGVLEDYLKAPEMGTVLLFLCRGTVDKRSRLYKRLSGGEVYCPPLKEAEAISWVQANAKRRGGAVEPQAARLMVAMVGIDAMALSQELDKLLSASLGRSITVADVEALVTRNISYKVFQLADYAAEGDRARAVALLEDMLQAGEAPVYLMAMLARQYRQLLMVRLMKDSGIPPAQMEQVLKVPSFAINRSLKQAMRYTLAQLKAAVTHLAGQDWAFKSGAVRDDRLALEEAVFFVVNLRK
nr:DNA polymerase III subunit delta [bacterium]